MSSIVPAVSPVQRNLLFLLAGLLALAVFLRSAPPAEDPYDLDAATPQGLLALRLWLEEMGHPVNRLDRLPSQIPTTDLRIIFPGRSTFPAPEAGAAAEWVAEGGTLVLVGPAMQDHRLMDALGVEPAADSGLVSHIRQSQPILPASAARWTAPGAVRGLDLDAAPAALPVLVAESATGGLERVTAALQPVGDGLIWHLDPVHNLTNANLRAEENAALVPAILRRLAPQSEVWIDTHHLHAVETDDTEIAGLRDWFYRTRWGVAVLLLCGLTLAYLAFQGVRLGPPLREVRLGRNREAAEFVDAMAGLYQRGNRRDAVARHIKQRLKVRLGRPLGLPGDGDDARFVRALREDEPRLAPESADRLEALLARLDQPLNDAELLQAAQEADALEFSNGTSHHSI